MAAPAGDSVWEAIRGLEALRRARSPRYARILAALLVALVVVVALVLALVPWQQTAFGSGQVVAYAPLERQQIVEAPFDGRVVEWYVKEGVEVEAGDPIAKVRDLDPRIVQRLERQRQAMQNRLDAAQDRVERLRNRIADLERAQIDAVAAAGFEARAAEDRLEGAQQEVEAARVRVVTARQQLVRQRELAEYGLTSTRSVELAELEHEQAEAALQKAKASVAAARKQLAKLRAKRKQLEAKTSAELDKARADLESARAEAAKIRKDLTELQSRIARQQSQLVVAPREGVILRLIATEGTELVKAGDELAILVPEPQVRAAELWMDGNDAPLLRPGQEVRVQFEGWPALQLTGWPSLAIGTFAARIQLIDAAATEDGRVRVLVVPAPGEPWPSRAFLRQGMLARGWVLLGEVSLGWELWRKFNGFPPGMQREESPFLKEKKVLELRKRK